MTIESPGNGAYSISLIKGYNQSLIEFELGQVEIDMIGEDEVQNYLVRVDPQTDE